MDNYLDNTYPVQIMFNFNNVVQVTGGAANSIFFGFSNPSPGFFDFGHVVTLKRIYGTHLTLAAGGAGDRLSPNNGVVTIEFYKDIIRLGGLWNSNQYQFPIAFGNPSASSNYMDFPNGLEITQIVPVSNIGFNGGLASGLQNFTSLDSVQIKMLLYLSGDLNKTELS